MTLWLPSSHSFYLLIKKIIVGAYLNITVGYFLSSGDLPMHHKQYKPIKILHLITMRAPAHSYSLLDHYAFVFYLTVLVPFSPLYAFLFMAAM